MIIERKPAWRAEQSQTGRAAKRRGQSWAEEGRGRGVNTCGHELLLFNIMATCGD